MSYFKKSLAASFTVLLVMASWAAPARAQQSVHSFVAGERIAANYAYGYTINGAFLYAGNGATGTQTVTACPSFRTLPDGRQVNFFGSGAQGQALMPITFDLGLTTSETITPTSISFTNIPQSGEQQCAQITASFSNTHFASQNTKQVASGTFGLGEAVLDVAQAGGGVVSIDSSWGGVATKNATIALVPVFAGISIVDKTGSEQFWNPQGGATTLAAPATLTAATVGIAVNGANATAGFYTNANPYHATITCVDILGQEGPGSADFSFTPASGTTNQMGFTAPAAQTGCVGWAPYISLTNGTYTLSYKVPLVTQPSVAGVAPVSNGVCTLTTIETITPACKITNATYNQTGVGAVVSALTLNTSPIVPQSTIISTTSVYVPNPGGRTTYTWAPGSHIGAANVTVPSTLAFTIGAAAATVVPDVIGTVNIAPNAMNSVGKILRICGEATTTASAATIVDIQFQWDAVGQNTAGKGVLIGDLTATPVAAIATAGHATFCQDFQTTVASASATGGSINHVNGFGAVGGVSLIAPGALSDAVTPGAIGSLNLAVDARINIIYLHTTATDGAGWTLQNVSAQLI